MSTRIDLGIIPNMDGAPPRSFSDVVEARLAELGTNAFAVEHRFGLPTDAIRNAIRPDDRRAQPRIDRAREICEALGLEFYIGPPRDEPRQAPESPVELDGAAFAVLPLYNAEVSAGPGASTDAEEVVERLAFRREWLARIGVKLSKASLVKVRGDSMAPTLRTGDLVLIDRARTEGAKGRVYALVDVSGDTLVKRVERPDRSTLILRSDNSAYQSELRRGSDLERVRIIGEVRWSGHTW